VCGHIHHPIIRDISGVTYVNTGDFVESCSFVVELDDGTMQVMRWPSQPQLKQPETIAPEERALDEVA
jgi:UDP-2,3-diacylglucosamine pyrophosphatase LpxH